MERQAQTEASQKKHFVLNASVSLLWFLRDEPPDLCSKADLLFQDILDGKVIVHVPDRWLDEVCGGLVKAVHAKRLTLNEARDALRRVFRMISLPNWHVHYSDLHWRHEEVTEWAMATSVSFYDAIYLFVAESINGMFWTADRKLYEFLTRRGNSPRIKWIGDYAEGE